MSDHDEIRNLCARYAFQLDEGDFDGVAEVLADADLRLLMTGVSPRVVHGREAVRAFYADQVVTHDGGRPMTRHVITNQLIEVTDDGAGASSRTYFTLFQGPPDRSFELVAGGQYLDRFERSATGWRFVEKVIQVDFMNDVTEHFDIAEEHAASGSPG